MNSETPTAGQQTRGDAGDDRRPLVAHVLFRLGVGGLENGLVNLVNSATCARYRHAIVCIDTVSEFSERITRDDVELVEIKKRPGTDPSALWRLYKTFRRLRPNIVHTRNLAALDALLPAFLAGVRCRVHGEHGWDINDVHGTNRKLMLLRRLHAPLVTHYVALAKDQARYLEEKIGVRAAKISQLYNGVDIERFRPLAGARPVEPGTAAAVDERSVVIGTVGRLEQVKDQATLVEAFIELIERHPRHRAAVRLAIVGDGSCRQALEDRLREAGLFDLAWLPGTRDDVPAILQSLDVFVLPSLAEGVSNTILEAMACGLPVVATDVGGNGELVVPGETGMLVPPDDPGQMARALAGYLDDESRRARHGAAGRKRIEQFFDIEDMLKAYLSIYDNLLGRAVTQ